MELERLLGQMRGLPAGGLITSPLVETSPAAGGAMIGPLYLPPLPASHANTRSAE